ncbi:MAG: ribbon-helix-helix domain-containing protein [Rhizobiales bacterium]|nr:ribbon-helix-helix domain-containing protein [Hyphomicrobiales bacterium]
MNEASEDISVKKRSVIINGHATSIALENAFWQELRACAKNRKISVNQLVSDIDAARHGTNLSSAIRIFILKSLQEKLAGAGS